MSQLIANKAILIIGEKWQAQALTEQLKRDQPNWRLDLSSRSTEAVKDNISNKNKLKYQLICWLLQEGTTTETLSWELNQLKTREPEAALLLIINNSAFFKRDLLLQLPLDGLLEQPSLTEINEAIELITNGGRVFRISEAVQPSSAKPSNLGIKQWFLLSGLDQINAEVNALNHRLEIFPQGGLQRLVTAGRLRELNMARKLLHTIWGSASPIHQFKPKPKQERLQIYLPKRGGNDILNQLQIELAKEFGSCSNFETGYLLALEALLPERRLNLFESLLHEFKQLLEKLSTQNCLALTTIPSGDQPATDPWVQQQSLLRQRALMKLVGAYTQLPREGSLLPLAETLIGSANLDGEEPELCSLYPILIALIEGKPLLIDGKLMAADQPFALLHLQTLVSNWLLRNGERIAKEVLEACSNWPELRRTMLPLELLPTRELDRLRNKINSLERWQNLFVRPVSIYESKRVFYSLRSGKFVSQVLIEPRDNELKNLLWWQQAITIMLETRDALAPQLEILINRFGSLMVLLLTRVLGRAIGLIGRGIMQGLGKGMQNSNLSAEKS
ncbi:DUF3685 domain-containing protein [Synechococcus lacustris]|uniref:DUF3685 domain-containing protein n=1 Tax=Synechococcus lacustris TaxID=2116544 RepID=UPI0020CB92AA|nr:DUF3685 domain-containing protein [Synechococcus lacustris]MCP9810497.1 DUF3685 domain-containing protein [Synechococcus lacustris Maggiore-St4-Slac]